MRRPWLCIKGALVTIDAMGYRIDPKAFQRCFRQWTDALAEGLGLTHIAMNGET
jgi:predicted transposase YbfD/YdcC